MPRWRGSSLKSWHAVERATGLDLVTQAGGLFFHRTSLSVGSDEPTVGQGTGALAFSRIMETLATGTTPFELLNPSEVTARFPAIRLPEDASACHVAGSGFLDASASTRALVAAARAAGAMTYEGHRVLGLDVGGPEPVVHLRSGSNSAAGSWW